MAEDKAESERRELAILESRGCQFCGGAGTLVVYHPSYEADRVLYQAVVDPRTGEVKQQAVSGIVAAHCICPYGRWIRGRNDADVRRRVVDVEEILAGRSGWRIERPDLPVLESPQERAAFVEWFLARFGGGGVRPPVRDAKAAARGAVGTNTRGGE